MRNCTEVYAFLCNCNHRRRRRRLIETKKETLGLFWDFCNAINPQRLINMIIIGRQKRFILFLQNAISISCGLTSGWIDGWRAKSIRIYWRIKWIKSNRCTAYKINISRPGNYSDDFDDFDLLAWYVMAMATRVEHDVCVQCRWAAPRKSTLATLSCLQ